MDSDHLSALASQIKLNCNISDSKYWGYYSICGLLMRYRDLYRSEHSLMPWDGIPRDHIALWIEERETLWRSLENDDLNSLEIDGKTFDPFDIEGVGPGIKNTGLVYGSGYGMFCKPTFFLAELDRYRELYDHNIFYAGKELCRDLFASPAMLQGGRIYIRHEVLRTMLWEKFLEMSSGKYAELFDQTFLCYGVDKAGAKQAGLFETIERIVRDVSELFVLHEVGEAEEDDYSDEWGRMLGGCCDKFSEIYIRGIKDVLADTSGFGPLKKVVGERNRTLLGFYMVFLEGLRKELFPEIRSAYARFLKAGDWSLIEDARTAGHNKARKIRDDIVALWMDGKNRNDFIGALKKYSGLSPS